MINWIQKRLQDKEEGFTLIELMVVVLIIAILIAIAIPTFLGARGRAQDRAAQSSLRNTVTAAKALFTDNEDYKDATTTALESAEPALTFTAAANNSTQPPNQVSVDGDPANAAGKSTAFVAAARSANGDKCWFVTDRVSPNASPGTWWRVTNGGDAACNADLGAAVSTFDTSAPYASGAWVRQPGQAAL